MAVKTSSRNWGGPRKGSGRPLKKAPRCPCRVMTLKRARARGRTYEHAPSCSFYPADFLK